MQNVTIFYAAEIPVEHRQEISAWLRTVDTVDTDVVAGFGFCDGGIVVDEFDLDDQGLKYLDPETKLPAYKGFRVVPTEVPERIKDIMFRRDS